MTVYIAHESKNDLNLAPAEEFGEIRFVFSKEFSPGFSPKEAKLLAEAALADFDFQDDYFLIAGGDPIAGMVASMALADLSVKRDLDETTIKTLRYTRDFDEYGNRSISRYVPIEVNL